MNYCSAAKKLVWPAACCLTVIVEKRSKTTTHKTTFVTTVIFSQIRFENVNTAKSGYGQILETEIWYITNIHSHVSRKIYNKIFPENNRGNLCSGHKEIFYHLLNCTFSIITNIQYARLLTFVNVFVGLPHKLQTDIVTTKLNLFYNKMIQQLHFMLCYLTVSPLFISVSVIKLDLT